MSRTWRLVLVLSLILAVPALAQTVTGTIQGTVTDRSGGVLPGVTVTIRNAETGLTRVVVTNEAGFFNAPFLPLGMYTVGAELAGFGSSRRSDVDGVSNFRPIAVDPNWSGGWHVDHPMDSAEKMNPTKFRRATVDDSLEDLIGRNTYYSDGLEQVDLGLYKSFGVLGNSVVLRLDVFKLFNHITWGIPTTDFANVNFGRILSTNYTPRTFQLGARFLF